MQRKDLIELVTRADHLVSGAVLEASLDLDKVDALVKAIEEFKAHARMVHVRESR